LERVPLGISAFGRFVRNTFAELLFPTPLLGQRLSASMTSGYVAVSLRGGWGISDAIPHLLMGGYRQNEAGVNRPKVAHPPTYPDQKAKESVR
jgi:hypothetical protein